MNNFLKSNKTMIIYSSIVIMFIPIIGSKLFISFLGNIILLLFLIPILLLLVLFVSLNSFKSKINICKNCGSISLGINNTCLSCGAELKDINKKSILNERPSESTIEVKAEEIK